MGIPGVKTVAHMGSLVTAFRTIPPTTGHLVPPNNEPPHTRHHRIICMAGKVTLREGGVGYEGQTIRVGV